MVWNEEKALEKAIFLKKEGMELETKKERGDGVRNKERKCSDQ